MSINYLGNVDRSSNGNGAEHQMQNQMKIVQTGIAYRELSAGC